MIGKPKIAFLGTGLMGAPMARRLLDAGFPVTVWNRDAGKAEPLAANGAEVAASPADAVAGAAVVFTMLTNGQAVSEVLFERGVADALPEGTIVVDCSSIAPPIAREHADAGGETSPICVQDRCRPYLPSSRERCAPQATFSTD